MTTRIPLTFHEKRPEPPAPGDCWIEQFGDPQHEPLQAIHFPNGSTLYVEISLKTWSITGSIKTGDIDVNPSVWINQGRGAAGREWHGFIRHGVLEEC